MLLWSGARRWWIAGGAAAVVVAIAVVAWFARSGPAAEPKPRQYADVTACLLTDSGGVTADLAKSVWAGMEDASLHTHGQTRFLPVLGDQGAANAQSFLGTLILGKCAVIVAVGPGPVAAVDAPAPQHAGQKFIVVNADATHTANVMIVSKESTSDIRVAVTVAVQPFLQNRS
jgi:hypothetical protein